MVSLFQATVWIQELTFLSHKQASQDVLAPVRSRQYTGAAETHINCTVPYPRPPYPHPAQGACLLLADFPGPPDPLSVPLVVLAAFCFCLFHFGEQLVFLSDAVHSCHV